MLGGELGHHRTEDMIGQCIPDIDGARLDARTVLRHNADTRIDKTLHVRQMMQRRLRF